MNDNYINTTAIFGEVKKYILSKDFKFGQLTNVFGRTTVDFSNADINGAVILDSTQFFGEIRIKVPANWHVIAEVTNIFATVDDKRRNPTVNIDANKVLVLRGTGIFGAVNIIDCVN
jgi:predicted membrane protein